MPYNIYYIYLYKLNIWPNRSKEELYCFDWVKRATTIDDILKFGASTGLMVKPIKIKKKKRKKRCFLNLWQSGSIKDPYPILDQRDYWGREGVLVPMAFKNFRQSSNSFFILYIKNEFTNAPSPSWGKKKWLI